MPSTHQHLHAAPVMHRQVVKDIQQILTEQEATEAAAPELGRTLLWVGRALLEAGQPGEAHPYIDAALARLTDLTDRSEGLLSAQHWHAACLLALGNHDGAKAELTELITKLSTGSPEDELLVASRQLLGSVLARSGKYDAAINEFDSVVDTRLLLDWPDAPRVLRARYSRAACLLFLELPHHALTELNSVIADATDGTHVGDVIRKARNDRAVCFLMSGNHQGALDDLDYVIRDAVTTLGPDDLALLHARQQRAVSLMGLERRGEALAELDAILAATTFWGPNPFRETVQTQRATW